MKKMVRGDLPYSESVLGRIFIIYTLFTFKTLLIFHQLKNMRNQYSIYHGLSYPNNLEAL